MVSLLVLFYPDPVLWWERPRLRSGHKDRKEWGRGSTENVQVQDERTGREGGPTGQGVVGNLPTSGETGPVRKVHRTGVVWENPPCQVGYCPSPPSPPCLTCPFPTLRERPVSLPGTVSAPRSTTRVDSGIVCLLVLPSRLISPILLSLYNALEC